MHTHIHIYLCACVHAMSLQLCLTFCDAMDCSPPVSSVNGILQAKILEWVCHALLQGIFPTQGLNPYLLHLPALASRFFTTNATWEAHTYLYVDGIHTIGIYTIRRYNNISHMYI